MGGDSKWRKMKLALGLNTCLYLPKTTDEDESTHSPSSRSRASARSSDVRHRMPTTPTPSSSGLQMSKYGIKSSSKQMCAICLTTMKSTNGHAIFTAECSHSFHFHCITSNVKHGNRVCPICRARWKEIPLEDSGSTHVKSSINPGSWAHQDSWMLLQGMPLPPQQTHSNRNVPLLFQTPEPAIFDDDELLVNQKVEEIVSGNTGSNDGIEMKTYPEVSAVERSKRFDNFGILINLKAPVTRGNLNARAPLDLVTVLDISGSMTGTKIALLKQAMGFVIQNLGPLDRLSVIAFSSSARRLFPLRRMTETGKQESLQLINSLVANGGTNIAEALRKGAKVMTDRKFKNPVSSMILLSDGQDTYTSISPRKPGLKTDYMSLLPDSLQNKKDETRIPIHTFGFGIDHDASAMHTISEHSGGMFSFIEAENVIQDAFAQCIGGLLSVVVQELRVEVECVHPVLKLGSIKAGSYKVGMVPDARSGFIEVGDLYAEEERDFLVTVGIPVQVSGNEMSLVKFRVIHKDPIRKRLVTVEGNEDVVISRPEIVTGKELVSVEVDRQRNRLRAASAIAAAQAAAERGDLAAATLLLEECRKKVAESVAARGGDRLCMGLVAELREMKERMASRSVYESSGRAYVLSGLSSHSWQRATARGDSTEITSQMQTYQTRSMVDMVNMSQTMCLSRSPSSSVNSVGKKSLRSIHSFPAPQPR